MRSALIAFSVFIAGCVPAPHYEQLTPPLDGVVMQGGQPVAGAEVVVSYAEFDSDNHPEERTVTDAEGRFKLPPLREFHFFLFVAIGDRIDASSLTIKSGGKDYLGSSVVAGLSRDRVDFQCELDAPMPWLNSMQFCKPIFPKRN